MKMKNTITTVLLLFSTGFLFGQTTLAEWNFPNDPDNAIADGGISANAAKTISTGGGTSAVAFSQAGATTNSASATGWTAGSGTKFWMIELVTTGYHTITVSSKQRSTNTGPRDFVVEYRIGMAGDWNSITGGTVLTANDFTSGVLTNLALPAACDNQPLIFIRWIQSSNTAVDGLPVAGGGNSNIDDIKVRGILSAGTTSPTDYFRSAQSGVWDEAATWESSPDNTVWTASSLVPTSAANVITIQNLHSVTINSPVSADQLTINSGGALIHNNGIVFTLNDDPSGTDMTVFGSYTINGTMPAGTGTVSIEESASVFVLTNTGGQSDNFAYSSRVLFKSNSNFYWSTANTFETDGIIYFPNSGPGVSPKFIINAAMGNIGSNNPTVFNGLLEVRNTITFNAAGLKTFRDGIITASPGVLNQTASCGQFYLNGLSPQLGGTGIINLSNNGMQVAAGSQALLVGNQQMNNASFTVNGSLVADEYQLTGTVNFNLAGTLFTQHSNGISSTGTLANTGTITFGSNSTVMYNRTSMQGDQQFTSRADYANVSISGGSQKLLNGPSTMSGQLLLNNGLVVTTSTNLLTITATGSSSGANSLSFVSGPLRKLGSSDFIFPVGKQMGGYRWMGLSNLTGSADFTCEFMRANARLLGNGLITAPGLQRVSQCEYWTLTQNAGNVSADVTLIWTSESPCNVSYVTDPPTVVVAHFNGAGWDSYGGAGVGSATPGSGSVTWAGISTFSQFALGSTDISQNPLPLELSAFTAKAKNKEVVINWYVLHNDEQEEYLLERSKDGVNFELLKTIPAKLISGRAAYTEPDQHPLSGWNYYRLKAIDRQGRGKISYIVKVFAGSNQAVWLSPNPASEKLVINLSDPSSISEIELVNISGQVLKKIKNIQFYTELNISHLQAGLYYLRILGKYGLRIKSFVKN